MKKETVIGEPSAAKILGVTTKTLRLWRIAGLIPYKRLGGRYFFNVEELEKLIGKTKKTL